MSEWMDAESHADRALRMYERGRWAEAEAELRKALSMNPQQPEWHFNLALTLEAAGREVEAMASYERAIELMPGQAEPLTAAAIVAIRLNRLDHALNWLNQALLADPRNELAYAHQMDCLIRLGRMDEAETAFYVAQERLEEPSAQCLAMMGECLLQRKSYERAGWCLREAIKLDPALPRLRARLAMIHAATGQPHKAMQLYLRDLRDDPGNVDTLLDIGELLVELGRLPEAAEKFRRVLELEPANVDAHERLGRIALRSGRSEQAALEFELVLKLDPEYPGIRMSLAEALIRRRRTLDARAVLRDELDVIEASEGQRDGNELTRLGSMMLDVGSSENAAVVFRLAVKRQPADADVHRKLALALFQSGDRRGGTKASRRVLRIEPRCLVSMHNLALAALQDGRLKVAAAWISRGLKINREDEGLRRLRMRVWMAQVRAAFSRDKARAKPQAAAR